MKKQINAQLLEVLENIDKDGNLFHRESNTLEFKENYNWGSKIDYTKVMASFANNKGGFILFGVKNSPRKPIGIEKARFDSIQEEKITSFLLENFSPEIKWETGLIEVASKWFGYIYTYEAEEKPVICKKSSDEFRSGDIFYRYRGQSKKIEFAELKKIIDDLIRGERTLWMHYFEKIARTGPKKIALIDLETGKFEADNVRDKKIIVDRKLLDSMNQSLRFVKEGQFNETLGEPVLKIVGEIESSEFLISELDPNRDYPFIQKQLAEELDIKPFDVQVLIWKYGLKGDKKYHIPITTSKSGTVHKFSREALSYLRERYKTMDRKALIKEYLKKDIH